MVKAKLVFLLLPLLLVSSVTAKTRLVITYETKENPPFYLGVGAQVSAHAPGISIEFINEIAEKLGFEVTYRRAPWQRGLFMLKNNHVDAIFHASYNEERESIGRYPMKEGVVDESRSMMPQSYYFYVKKPNTLNWDGASYSLIKGKVGAVIGYAVADYLVDKQVEVVEVRSQLIGLKMLQYGRIDAFAGIETMVDYQLQAHSAELVAIEKTHLPIMTKSYYLLFAKQFYQENPVLAERIWDEMKVMRASGRYEEIAARYRNGLN